MRSFMYLLLLEVSPLQDLVQSSESDLKPSWFVDIVVLAFDV